MSKLLSVIVPSYNMEKYLPKCLGSLIVDDAELLSRLDVIVVNDGSTDRTSEIAHDFERRHPGVFRVIDKPNGHYGSCINAGLEVALGMYVKILDADDWFDTDAFGRYLSFLRERVCDSAVDLVVSDFCFLCNGEILRKSYAYAAEPGFDVSEFNFVAGRDLWMHAVAYKTNNLRKIHYRQMTGITHTDVQWIHTPMKAVGSIAYFGEPLYIYQEDRQGNTSAPKAFLKTFHDLVSVTKQLIIEFSSVTNECVLPQQQTYLRNHILFRARRVYHVCILDYSPLLKPGILEDFDAFLQQHAKWLYDELANETILNRLQFHYVADWRLKGCRSLRLKMVLFLAHCYGTMRKLSKGFGL